MGPGSKYYALKCVVWKFSFSSWKIVRREREASVEEIQSRWQNEVYTVMWVTKKRKLLRY
jgi:hypothetical protein